LLEPLTVISPWLTTPELAVLDARTSPVLGATVSVPAPPHVTEASFNALAAVLKSCAAAIVVPDSDRTPPEIVPLSYTKVPAVTNTVSPVPIAIVPTCRKLGVVPDCEIVSFALALIVPRFTCWAEALVSVSGRASVRVPSLSSFPSRVRGPFVPESARISALGAFVSVPFVTCRVAPYEDVLSVSTIVPLFVKPFATVRFDVLYDPSPCSRSVAPLAFVTESLNAVLPWASRLPRLTSRELIVLNLALRNVPAATVSLPLPPHVAPVNVNVVVAVLKSCGVDTVAEL